VRVELGYEGEYGGTYEKSFRISREKLAAIRARNPVVYLGQLAGENTFIYVEFNYLCVDEVVSTCAVEETSRDIPYEIEEALERRDDTRARTFLQ